MKLPFLGRRTVRRAARAAADRGVSVAARGPGGFTRAYVRSSAERPLSDDDRERRRLYLARAVPQGHALEDWEGCPTRYALALACWAYHPDPRALRTALERAGY